MKHYQLKATLPYGSGLFDYEEEYTLKFLALYGVLKALNRGFNVSITWEESVS